MKLKNYWIGKKKEKLIIKIIRWAQKNFKKVELLTNEEITLALREEK